MHNSSVLVTEAHTVGSIAVIRSLGRAGYNVIAVSPHEDAIGFKSRFVAGSLANPEYAKTERLCSFLDAVVDKYNIDCIIPSEGFLIGIKSAFEKYQHLLPLSEDKRTVYRGMSKADLFETFLDPDAPSELQENLPRTVVLHSGDNVGLDSALSSFNFPVFIKSDAIYSSDEYSGNVIAAKSVSETLEILNQLMAVNDRVVLQEFAAGTGVGVFLLRWNGCIHARLMHKRLHEVPHTGGVSSYRTTWWQQEIYDDAVRRMEYLDWQGAGMFEYRWDRDTGSFKLMELNGRFWGSLHLALFAGVDFPRILLDLFRGSTPVEVPEIVPTRCRLTFPKEIEHVWSRFKDENIGFNEKTKTLLEFLILSVNPRIRSDLWFPGDRQLYFRMASQSIRGFLS